MSGHPKVVVFLRGEKRLTRQRTRIVVVMTNSDLAAVVGGEVVSGEVVGGDDVDDNYHDDGFGWAEKCAGIHFLDYQ